MSEIKFVSVSVGKILFPLTEDNKVSGVIEHKGKTFNINEIVTDVVDGIIIAICEMPESGYPLLYGFYKGCDYRQVMEEAGSGWDCLGYSPVVNTEYNMAIFAAVENRG